MNLKQAYTYQNFLDKKINEAVELLCRDNFVLTKKQSLRKSESDKNMNDEEINVNLYKYDFTPTNVVDFLVKALEEKEKLSESISKAKASLDMDIDKSMAMNKVRQRVIGTLDYMGHLKSQECEKEGYGYRINSVTNTQEKFVYPIKEVTTINFDRKDVKRLVRKYRDMNDELSNKKDILELSTEVNYDPIWDVSCSFEDVVRP